MEFKACKKNQNEQTTVINVREAAPQMKSWKLHGNGKCKRKIKGGGNDLEGGRKMTNSFHCHNNKEGSPTARPAPWLSNSPWRNSLSRPSANSLS